MQITENRAVALAYTLTVDPGVVVDTSDSGNPLWYIHGRGQLLPSFEQQLEGLAADQSKTFTLTPSEGYGEFDAQRVVDVPKFAVIDQNITPGEVVGVRGPGGKTAEGMVEEIGKEMVKINFNHPLAGKILTFDVKVLEVRVATKEELSHGHVHPDGNHNH